MKHTGRPGRNGSAGRKVLNILLTFLLIFLILVLIGMGYTLAMLGKMNYIGMEATISTEELESYLQEHKETRDPEYALDPAGDIVLDTVPGEVIEDENVVHILLIGEDARPGESRGRSDAMLLCSFHLKENRITVTSFMRDMYVTIPGYTDHKLNSAYAWGGMKLLNETILVNFGISVDGNFVVDFTAFQEVIDALGGVEINLTAEEARYLGLNQGINRLNGTMALAYARIRSIGDGDFGRTDRQRKVIQALMEKGKSMNISSLHSLLDKILPLVRTNMEETRILQYGASLLPLLAGGCETEKLCIPAEGAYRYAWAKEMSVLLPDLEKNREILQNVIYEK